MDRRQVISGVMFFMLLGFFILGGINNNLLEFDDNDRPSIEETGLPISDDRAPDFTLPSIDGSNYTFSSDLGKIRLVTFLYTKCPGTDGCSLITIKMASLLQQIKLQEMTYAVKFVTIDFDYIDDTMEDLQNYAQTYSQSTNEWQFLFGSENETRAVTDSWGYDFQRNHDHDLLRLNHGTGDEFEPWIHPFITYVIDQNGFIRYELLNNLWEVNFAFEIIEYLYNL